MNNKRASFASVLASLHPLPSPRGAALRLLQIAQREDASIEEIVRVAMADPALAGRLIHAANRLRPDTWPQSGSLQVAVQRLGFNSARQIALGFSLVGAHMQGACSEFDYANFWTTSLLRGLAAQALASRKRTADPSEAFVLGLLLDVGRLALSTARPREYGELLAGRPLAGKQLRAAEREQFGIDHAELSVVLLSHWMFPAETVEAARSHFESSGSRTGAHAGHRNLLLAEAIAQSALAGSTAGPAWAHLALDSAGRSGITPESLDEIAAGVTEEAAAWAPLLRLPVPKLTEVDFSAHAEASSGSSRLPASPDLRILLVDDEEDEHLLLRPVLESHGYAVNTANCAREAIESIFDAPPHIVITDWQMPGMNGPELCSALRSTRLGSRLYLMIRTGKAREEDLVAGIHAGANDFVSKTSAERVLLARIAAGAKAARGCEARIAELARVTRCASDLAVLGLT